MDPGDIFGEAMPISALVYRKMKIVTHKSDLIIFYQ